MDNFNDVDFHKYLFEKNPILYRQYCRLLIEFYLWKLKKEIKL